MELETIDFMQFLWENLMLENVFITRICLGLTCIILKRESIDDKK